MNTRILLCTDLDRTLLPNGHQPESPNARERFAALVQRREVDVAYVTGRHLKLVLDAIEEYELPQPDYILADVGTTIYHLLDAAWQAMPQWRDEISPDWNNYQHNDLAAMFADIDVLALQEPEKQNTYKLSYYTPEDVHVATLIQNMQERLLKQNVRASLIWSVDEVAHQGLLDVLPERATKLHAIEFLMRYKGYSHENTVFSGDSGNDLPVLVSHIQSVLVANAQPDVREQAKKLAEENGEAKNLYLARGGLLGMNGNYSAGILEGVIHYIPETIHWFE